MIRLTDAADGKLVGEVTEQQFKVLAGDLEEESVEDEDYWIDEATLEMLEEDGADPKLVAMLKKALGAREGFDCRWQKV
jgi:processive 1,2-diacylglycerol beta-glucosyltransferase